MSQSNTGVWDDILTYLKQQISDVEFNTWFGQVKPLGMEDGVFILGVPHSFARDWITAQYGDLINEAFKEFGINNPNISYRILPQGPVEQTDMFSEEPAKVTREPSRVQLNPKYIFKNFVIGPNNSFANAAATGIANSNDPQYNPLFIYGASGLGKTHLMQAAGHLAREHNPNTKIEYVTTETFTNELITSIQTQQMSEFRDRYRSVDLLLIDDIQFIAGKERTQEEFFHTFNTLYESGSRLIISSDRPPRDIPTLEARLRSRFEWGLIADVQKPDLETRMAILSMNAEYRGVLLDKEVIDYIARNVTSSVRELEGALVRAIVYTSLYQIPLNRENAVKALAEVLDPQDATLTLDDILSTTAKHFDVEPALVRGRGRQAALVTPRQIAMYLARELTPHSYPEIAEFFGGRDHSTVIYAVRKVNERISADTDVRTAINDLKEALL